MTPSDKDLAELSAWLCEKGMTVRVGKSIRFNQDYKEPEKAQSIRAALELWHGRNSRVGTPPLLSSD